MKDSGINLSDHEESKSVLPVVLEYQIPGSEPKPVLKYRPMTVYQSYLTCALAFAASIFPASFFSSDRAFLFVFYAMCTFPMMLYYGIMVLLDSSQRRKVIYPILLIAFVMIVLVGGRRCPHATYVGIGRFTVAVNGKPCRNTQPAPKPWWMSR